MWAAMRQLLRLDIRNSMNQFVLINFLIPKDFPNLGSHRLITNPNAI
jgi:hypothetical protein